jgi:hypothetical protein
LRLVSSACNVKTVFSLHNFPVFFYNLGHSGVSGPIIHILEELGQDILGSLSLALDLFGELVLPQIIKRSV